MVVLFLVILKCLKCFMFCGECGIYLVSVFELVLRGLGLNFYLGWVFGWDVLIMYCYLLMWNLNGLDINNFLGICEKCWEYL